MVNSMEKESTDRQMGRRRRAYGRMERESDGLMRSDRHKQLD
jgi:hypothetical protein